jgi:hypothetical protein
LEFEQVEFVRPMPSCTFESTFVGCPGRQAGPPSTEARGKRVAFSGMRTAEAIVCS